MNSPTPQHQPQHEPEALPTRIVFRCFVSGVTDSDRPFKTERAARAFYEKMCARYGDRSRVTLRRLHETKHGYWWCPDTDHPETYTVALHEPEPWR